MTHDDGTCGARGPTVRVSADELRPARCNLEPGHDGVHVEQRPDSGRVPAKWST